MVRTRVKKLTVILILQLLVLVPTAAISAQKITSGTSCKVLNQKTVYLKKAYVCLKSGKKLVWSKGTSIPKPVPSETKFISPPTPTQSQNPTPAATPTATPTETFTRDPIVSKIQNALAKELTIVNLNLIDEAVTGILIIENGISNGNIDATKLMMKKLYVAQAIMKLKKPPVVILGFTESFVKSEFSKYCSDGISWVGTGQYTMDKYRNWALAGCLDTNPTQIIPMPKGEVTTDHIPGALGSDMGYVAIGKNANTSKLPGWFVRGLKGVVAEYVNSIGSSEWLPIMNGSESCVQYKLSELSYSYEINSNWCQTSLGQGVARFMVSSKGLTQTLQLINQMHTVGAWSEADFERFMGTPFSIMESEAKDYVVRLAK
jgi:hypothetical protein